MQSSNPEVSDGNSLNSEATHRQSFRRVLISIPQELLAAADRQAKADYTTRSELIRHALLTYLRPPSGQSGQQDERELYADPEEVLEILQRNKLKHSLQQILKDNRRRRHV